MKLLQAWEESGEIDLYYFDEMGVNLQAVVAYNWQEKSEAVMPARQSQNLTRLAFMTRSNQLYPFTCQGAATSQVVVACFEDFVQTIGKQTVVIFDNACGHPSKLFESKRKEWTSLSDYSPLLF